EERPQWTAPTAPTTAKVCGPLVLQEIFLPDPAVLRAFRFVRLCRLASGIGEWLRMAVTCFGWLMAVRLATGQPNQLITQTHKLKRLF
ncbi:unnamed protein product, partial [Cladocopium goreaui]